MNTPNNKRKKESAMKIKRAFIQFLQTREINEISVSDICKQAQINRSTFYANFLDIYDLADKMRDDLHNDVHELYGDSIDSITLGMNQSLGVLPLLKHIKENQIFYNTYFKLGYDSRHQVSLTEITVDVDEKFAKHIEYHIEFFRNGFNSVIKLWLKNGCKESPEEIAGIIRNEYIGRKF
ncbi:MAG: TetR/AcrR family transcriptional regulator C-terminal domain-containing protein [Clostridia bacterium]|nr:TetR/AcrR family transcriptional regulator C-terminal domain-containing protein [Clostridia bacterium]